ncbi:MAG: peptidase MA domain-containing protein [Dehalococcoidales bacterium]|nr:peptidase MA domain-containing protein [Dehalococcoidales bacterium]
MIKKISSIALALILLAVLMVQAVVPLAALTQSSISVTESSAVMEFPLYLNFSANISSAFSITDIRLKYEVDQMSFASVTSEVFIEFTPSTSVNARYMLDMRKIGGLPPGTSLDFWWSVKDDGGNRLDTSRQSLEIEDNRYKWKRLSEGKINLYWYKGDDSFAGALMATAQESLQTLARDTGVYPPEEIDIYIYNGSGDLQGSMIYPSEWTGGVAFTSFNIVAIGITPGNLEWGKGAMAHELTHIVIHQVTFNPYNGLPVWLDEGLAMYSEGPLTTQFSVPLAEAILNDAFISIRSISSPFSADAGKANLSYAESFSLVDYLVKTYSADKMLDLLDTFKQGSTYDGAFQKVYGIDMDQLEREWKSYLTPGKQERTDIY